MYMHHRLLLFCFIILTASGTPAIVFASRLIKPSNQTTVYFIDDHGYRHPYPNQKTFESWHGSESQKSKVSAKGGSASGGKSQKIEIVSIEELAQMPLGKNVTFRPGSLVKIPTNPAVYAVEPGGILRPIIGEQTAKDLYGTGWAKKIADVPEVFFSDYLIGAPVRSRADLPDGTLVRLEGDLKWYLHDKGVLTAFHNETALRENNLSTKNAVIIPRIFSIRSRVITGEELRITQPLWNIPLNSADCASDNLRAAVLYVSRGGSGTIEKINSWRSATASAWERRTDVLSLINIQAAEEMPLDDRYLVDGKVDIQEISRTYFDTHPDTTDFLIIWNSLVPISSGEMAEFWPVTNSVEGLGKPLFARNSLYGSRGKLKGVIHMGRPGDYPLGDPAGMARAIETSLHEFLHQWSGETDFRDAKGADRTDLLTADTLHWSPFANFISPLGGWGWRDNGDGTFTSMRSLMTPTQLADLHFPDLDLYLMGLVPRHSVAALQYLEPKTPGEQLSSTMRGELRTVTIDDIVYGNGIRRCQVTSPSSP